MSEIVNSFRSCVNFGCSFTYEVQETIGEIPNVLGLVEGFAGEDKIVLLLGDNLFDRSIASYPDNSRKREQGPCVLLEEVGGPKAILV